jgi:hypothetical protein
MTEYAAKLWSGAQAIVEAAPEIRGQDLLMVAAGDNSGYENLSRPCQNAQDASDVHVNHDVMITTTTFSNNVNQCIAPGKYGCRYGATKECVVRRQLRPLSAICCIWGYFAILCTADDCGRPRYNKYYLVIHVNEYISMIVLLPEIVEPSFILPFFLL